LPEKHRQPRVSGGTRSLPLHDLDERAKHGSQGTGLLN